MTEPRGIALCISGQLREPEICLPRLASMADALQADVFISVWDEVGFKLSGGMCRWRLHDVAGLATSDIMPFSIINRFSEVFHDLPDHFVRLKGGASRIDAGDLRRVFPHAVTDVEDARLDLSFAFAVPDGNSLRMLYRAWRCNEMKRLAERRRGVYRTVIRCRPDIAFDRIEASDLDAIAEEEVLVARIDGADAIHDVFMASRSIQADRISALFGVAVAAVEGQWRNIHHELSDWLGRLRIKPMAFPHYIGIADHARNHRPVFRAALAENVAGLVRASAGTPAAPEMEVLHLLLALADQLDGDPAYRPPRALVADGAWPGMSERLLPSLIACATHAAFRDGEFQLAVDLILLRLTLERLTGPEDTNRYLGSASQLLCDSLAATDAQSLPSMTAAEARLTDAEPVLLARCRACSAWATAETVWDKVAHDLLVVPDVALGFIRRWLELGQPAAGEAAAQLAERYHRDAPSDWRSADAVRMVEVRRGESWADSARH